MSTQPVRKAAAAMVVGTWVVVHVVCTALYLLPQNPMTASWDGPVHAYMEPLFAQRWLLFAPEPATNSLKIWSRHQCSGAWTGWRDPAAPLLKVHQENRLSPAGKQLYISNNLARELSMYTAEVALRLQCRDAACEERRKAEVRKSEPFQRAIRYTTRTAPCASPEAVQFMIVQLYPTQFSERHKQKPFSFANVLEFEAIALRRSS